MQERGLTSFRQLSERSGVSERQLLRLRRGEILQMRLETVLKLSEALQVPVERLLEIFAARPAPGSTSRIASGDLAILQLEISHLQEQLEQQRHSLLQEFQRQSLLAIESWLISWSAAATKARENPDLPAARLLPLVKPLERLLQEWQVEAIASVGEELPYDPQLHQPVRGIIQPGERVRVRYAGYRHRGQLLFRAKVSPVS